MLKKYHQEAVFAAVAFIIASFSFGVGWLASRSAGGNHAPIVIEECAQAGH